jgi:hypothetical protein
VATELDNVLPEVSADKSGRATVVGYTSSLTRNDCVRWWEACGVAAAAVAVFKLYELSAACLLASMYPCLDELVPVCMALASSIHMLMCLAETSCHG